MNSATLVTISWGTQMTVTNQGPMELVLNNSLLLEPGMQFDLATTKVEVNKELYVKVEDMKKLITLQEDELTIALTSPCKLERELANLLLQIHRKANENNKG